MPAPGAATLWAIAPRRQGARRARQRRIIEAIADTMDETLTRHRIDTPLRRAHFLAQIAHESDGFATTEEYASGRAYDGRADLGNTEPGDGPRYKGRGLLQLTGRANYRAYGRALGVDLEAEPARAAEPRLSLRIACAYWERRGLNADADRDDLLAVTRKINGGTNGLASRKRYLARAKAALGVEGVALSEGARGPAVRALQRALAARGHALAADGIFGPATARATAAFQRAAGLAADGIAGPATRAALEL